MSPTRLTQSAEEIMDALLEGLKRRNIPFISSCGGLIDNLREVFIEEANELIIIPDGVLDLDMVRWILEVRTPLRIRLTFFTPYVTEYKVRLLHVVSELRNKGISIPNLEYAISVQEPSESNLNKLLDALENWHHLKTHGRPILLSRCVARSGSITPPSSMGLARNPALLPETAISSSTPASSSRMKLNDELHTKLLESIKTYWTENYLARFLNVSKEKVRELVKATGIQREVCGREVIYFFDRAKGLSTYFIHIIKGILYELGIDYEETPNHVFFLPQFDVIIFFFDGQKEQLPPLVEDYAKTNDLIVVVPEELRTKIGLIQDDYFHLATLSRDQISAVIKQVIKRRRRCVHFISN